MNCFSYFLSIFFSSTRKAYLYIFMLTYLIYYLLFFCMLAVREFFFPYQYFSVEVFLPHPYMAFLYGLRTNEREGFTWMLFDALLYFLLTLAFERRKYRNYFQTPRGDVTIQAVGVTKQYDGISVVSGISLQVNRQQIVGLLGPYVLIIFHLGMVQASPRPSTC